MGTKAQDIIYSMLKRIIDIAGAISGIMFFMPFFLMAAFWIKLDSHGPVFFIQRRCGKKGREFGMYKFRSMVKDAEILKPQLKNGVNGSVFKLKNDPRITRAGRFLRKTSMDELPQLFNVLKGEMSLVGPRPLAKEEMTGDEKWRELRLIVKPGITGLWQVKGRGSKEFSDWIHYDTEYIMNRSLFLDAKILIMTVGTVLRGKGAY